MLLLAITKDTNLINHLNAVSLPESLALHFYEKTLNPLDVMSYVCSKNPSAVIMDDDCLLPETAHIIKSIKKINKSIKLVFITSDSSVELGRTITPMGVHYYGVKPIEPNELEDLISSINNQTNLNNTFN
jgi:DNA-binding NarL/FixJ family response regulator